MTRRWKPMIVIYACFVCAISHLVIGYAYASRTEGYGMHLHRSFPFRSGKGLNALRDQRASQKPGGQLVLGSWGGQHISLEVTADGATAEYDCAHGTISRRISLDRRGRFSVPGTYVAEHGGPVREGQQSNSVPVQFTGSVSGKRMYLTVKGRGSGKVIGNFTLVYGQEALLVKCR